MANSYNKNTEAKGASATTLIYTTDKMTQFELENAIYSDYMIMKPLYQQFNQFLNFYINKKTVKYKFEFTLDGLDTGNYTLTIASEGIGSVNVRFTISEYLTGPLADATASSAGILRISIFSSSSL